MAIIILILILINIVLFKSKLVTIYLREDNPLENENYFNQNTKSYNNLLEEFFSSYNINSITEGVINGEEKNIYISLSSQHSTIKINKKLNNNNISLFLKDRVILNKNFYKNGPKLKIENIQTKYIEQNYKKNYNNKYLIEIGLSPIYKYSSALNETQNILLQLKKLNITDKYYFTVIYDCLENIENYFYNEINDDYITKFNSILVLGEIPENFLPMIYSHFKYKKTYNVLINENKWGMSFENIYTFNKLKIQYLTVETYKKVEIDFSKFFIESDLSFYKFIKKNFFQNFLEKKICEENLININNIKYMVYTCIKENINITHFPNIYFYSKDLCYPFELNYNDLFTVIKKNYIFLVLTPVQTILNNLNKTTWVLGRIFLEKFYFTFNLDSKEIGFYGAKEKNYTKKISTEKINNISTEIINNNTSLNKNIKIIYTKERSSKIIIIILISIFTSIMLTLILIRCYGKKYLNSKGFEIIKKRTKANELIDDFELYYKNDKI